MWGILEAVCCSIRPTPTSDGVIVTYDSPSDARKHVFMRNENTESAEDWLDEDVI